MNKLIPSKDVYAYVNSIWNDAMASAEWFSNRSEYRASHLVGVPEWEHSEDIYNVPGICDPFSLKETSVL